MIVFCEECGAKNDIEPNKIKKAPGYIRCHVCNEIIEIAMPEAFQARLELRFNDQVIEMNNGRPVVTMGRTDENALMVEDKHASRTHAVIVNRGNEFVLTDLSMNGTFIHVNGKRSMVLIRDDFVLAGDGIIGLGHKVASDSPDAISFTSLE